MIFEAKQPEKAAALFAHSQKTLIWACLQNVMGKIYVDSLEAPRSAMALMGDFRFFAGKADAKLARFDPFAGKRNFFILVPQDEPWAAAIEHAYGKRARKVQRYALKKEGDVFDKEKLRRAVEALPTGYEMKMMDEELFYRCKETHWCVDWVSNYDSYELYARRGLGAIILKDGEPVSGASSYAGYLKGIEIEIDTREDHRRRGLAYICGAKLILECLARGWYPSWDAHNTHSLALAEKLGYHFSHAYPAYEIDLSPCQGDI